MEHEAEPTQEIIDRFLLAGPMPDEDPTDLGFNIPQVLIYYMRIHQFYRFEGRRVACKIQGGLLLDVERNMIVTKQEAIGSSVCTEQNWFYKYPPVSLLFTFSGGFLVKMRRFFVNKRGESRVQVPAQEQTILPNFSEELLAQSQQFFPVVVNISDYYNCTNPFYNSFFYSDPPIVLGRWQNIELVSTKHQVDRLPDVQRSQWTELRELPVQFFTSMALRHSQSIDSGQRVTDESFEGFDYRIHLEEQLWEAINYKRNPDTEASRDQSPLGLILSWGTSDMHRTRMGIDRDLAEVKRLLFQLLIQDKDAAPFKDYDKARETEEYRHLSGEPLLRRVAHDYGERLTTEDGRSQLIIDSSRFVASAHRVFLAADRITQKLFNFRRQQEDLHKEALNESASMMSRLARQLITNPIEIPAEPLPAQRHHQFGLEPDPIANQEEVRPNQDPLQAQFDLITMTSVNYDTESPDPPGTKTPNSSDQGTESSQSED